MNSGNVGIGTASPTAYLHLKAGTATAGTAPLKFTTGVNLTAAESGAMEWDGTSLYMTTSAPARKTIAYTDTPPAAHTHALSSLTAAAAANTLANVNWAQTWNWDALSTTTAFALGSTSITSGKLLSVSSSATGMTGTLADVVLSGSNAANTGTVLKSSVTGAASAAVPLMVTNLGTGASFRVNDETGDGDTSPFMVSASGNVGIGTTTVNSPLVLVGNAFIDAGAAYIANASTISLAIGDNDTGFNWVSDGVIDLYSQNAVVGRFIYYSGSEESFAFGTNATTNTDEFIIQSSGTTSSYYGLKVKNSSGTDQFVVRSDGNVGVGMTSPTGRLDVLAGAARTGTHATSPTFYVTGTLTTGQTGPAAGNIEFRHDNGTQGIGFGYNTIYQAGSNANQELNLLSKGTSPITLNAYAYSTGNVGIGTSSPATRAHVVVDDATASGVTNLLTLDHTTSGAPAAGIGSGLVFRAEDSASQAENAGQIAGILTTVTSGSEAGALTFSTRTGGAALAERMRIDASGHLIPATTNTYNLGSASLYWNNAYINNLNVSGTGPYVLKAGDTMTGDLNMGSDGTGKKVFLAAQDAVNEGGEMTFNGSGAFADWNFDNYQGQVRMHTGGSAYFTQSTTMTTLAGDLTVTGNDIYGSGNLILHGAGTGYVEAKSDSPTYGLIIREYNSGDWGNIEVDANGLNFGYMDSGSDIVINASGYVGINTTAPEGSLSVNGDVGIGDPASTAQASHMLDVASTKGAAGTSGMRVLYPGGGGLAGTEFGALAHRDGEWKAVYAKAGTGGAIALYTDGEVDMMNGYVGIGTTTPSKRLHVSDPDWQGQIRAERGGIYIDLSPNTGTGASLIESNKHVAIYDGNGYLMLRDGKMSIGLDWTATPSHMVHIDTATAQEGIIVDAGTYPEIRFQETGTVRGYLAAAGSAGGYGTGTIADSMIFRAEGNMHLITNAGSVVETLTTSSTVGIGVTSPSAKLHIGATTSSATTDESTSQTGTVSSVGATGSNFYGQSFYASVGVITRF
ncbi:MAG: hypothetical protein RDV41_10665, partial [Planctomycetota bacterium]|nr:hypothetical protein [Planctomycetota bacterium]